MTALKYFIYRSPSKEPSDILLGLLLTFSSLVDCSLLLTRTKSQTLKFVLYTLHLYVLKFCIYSLMLLGSGACLRYT